MSSPKIRIFALGDSAITVEFGTSVSPDLNDRAIIFSELITAQPFPGFVESVPAYASASIFYDPVVVRREYPGFTTAIEAVSTISQDLMNLIESAPVTRSRKIEIPVDFRGDAAPDLEFVAQRSGIGVGEVIKLFTATEYRVYMLGFLPGFSYMGKVHDRIATPRKETPRTLVPKGSVGIAGHQTGIYSLDSPGGWQIVGRTDLDLFTPDSNDPSFLKPGDTVTFIPLQ